jgi:hypothetical protein
MTPPDPPPAPPGKWLLAIGRALLAPAIVADVVEPTIADLREEWLRAADRSARRLARIRGYLAFWSILAMAPFAFRNWPGRRSVPFWQIQGSDDMTRRGRIQLVFVLTVAGLAAGYGIARFRTPMYQASAVIQLIPAGVRPELVFSAPIPADSNRDFKLRSILDSVLSRTRMERLIREFDLYERERRTWILDDVVQKMRDDLDIGTGPGGTYVIKYAGANPATVMKVTERVAGYFKEIANGGQYRASEDGLAFLESRIDDSARRLQAISAEAAQKGQVSRPKQLELEVIEASYKNLLMRREDALAEVQMQRRQLGEQYVLVEAARLPEKPIGISRLQSTLIGGAIGAGVAVLIMAGAWILRLSRERRANVARRQALT